MTQPPLSRHIQLLEHALGVKLIDRSNRVIELTPAGRVFLLEARRILHLTESSTLAVRRMASGEAGTITLGFTASSGYSYLPRLLLQRAARTPNINMVLKEMVGTDQVDDLLTGVIDIGLMRSPVQGPGFIDLKVGSERLFAALPVGDPRLAEASLRLSDFDRQPLILFAQDGARHFHDLLAKLFAQEGIAPSPSSPFPRFTPCWRWSGPGWVPPSCQRPPSRCISTTSISVPSSPRLQTL